MNIRGRILKNWHKAENFRKWRAGDFLLRKRKEKKAKVRQYANSNENDYQFDVVLILLCADFVTCVPRYTVGNNLMQTDLSVWGMYQHADIVVKCVMIGLILASVVTWAIFFSKSVEFFNQKRRLKREQQLLAEARSLNQANDIAADFGSKSLSLHLLNEAQNELELSEGSDDNEGIKERTSFRLERRVAAVGRQMGRGNGYLATIGAISPFVGLFGTVWGIMNSFIGIAQTQTTNLAVVAPGIAEALLATAIGLVAAIPAVVIYNVFARQIGGFKAMLGDVAAQVLLLQSRDWIWKPAPLRIRFVSHKNYAQDNIRWQCILTKTSTITAKCMIST